MENYQDQLLSHQHRIECAVKSIKLSSSRNIDIYSSAIIRLSGDGFRIKEKGSQNIAKLIYHLYHERWLLEKYYKRNSYEGYWNLYDINNPHYYLLGNGEEILKDIRQSIIHSGFEEDDADINELIYDLCDREIELYNEDNKPYDELPSYKRLLLK